MPIYEYECGSCGHRLEAIQKMSDAALTECTACGQPTLKKLISAAGFQLKGSGWYATDFKDSGKKKPKSDAADSSTNKEKAGGGCGTGGCGSGGCGHSH